MYLIATQIDVPPRHGSRAALSRTSHTPVLQSATTAQCELLGQVALGQEGEVAHEVLQGEGNR